ncbi:hypothetical protein BH09ACT7_BH09ACT7_29800 [soil metagenome]
MLCSAFAFAVSAAPAAAFFTMPSAPIVAACPAGENEDLYTDNCVPELSPNVPGGSYSTPTPVTPDYSGQITESTPGDPNSLPEIDGIPCTGRDSGACIGLSEDAAPPVVPHSTLSSSP